MPKAFVNLTRSARSRILRRLPRGENDGAIRLDQDVNLIDHRFQNEGNAERQEAMHLEKVREDADDDPQAQRFDTDDSSNSSDSEVEEHQSDANNSSESEVEEHQDDGNALEDYGNPIGTSDSEDDNIGVAFDDFVEQRNTPLYAGAPVTVTESMCLILTLALKHNLTGTCIADLLTVVNLHCLQLQLRKLTFDRYKKFFSIGQAQAKKHFYCSKCFKPLQSAEAQCTCLKGASYFLQFPLVPQLNQLLQRDNFLESLQHRFTRQKQHDHSIEDIYDGSLYRQYFNNGFLSNPNNISFLWNSDGVPVYRSRNYSIWPFYLTINELPYKQRFERKNVLLAGLWFGPKKPQVNLFVMSFQRDLAKLYQGVPFQIQRNPNRVVVRALLLAGTCDLPAKSTFWNLCQFNAESGCPHCETTGTRVMLPSGTSLQVYNYVRHCVNRTSANVSQQAVEALQTGNPVRGVKGPTILDRIMPDFMAGMSVDSMHNASGIVKKILNLWFDSKYSHLPFSLRAVRSNVDELLLKIKPPKFIHRMPRSVDDLCHWKASELLVWLYYYSPVVLQGIMRPDFYQHFLKLVAGLSYLSSPSVDNDVIHVAGRLLHKFVEDFEVLYGLRHCSINIHLLLHLGDQVRTLGPLWTCSCFPFENLNATLLHGIHGNTNVDSQLTRHYWQVLCSARYFDHLRNGPVRDFCLWKRKQFQVLSQIADSCYSVGFYVDLQHHERVIHEALLASRVVYMNVRKYLRLFKGNVMLISEGYSRALQTKSSFCMYMLDNVKYAGNIICFVKACHDCDPGAKCECPGQHYAIIKKVSLGERLHVEYAHNAAPVPLHYVYKCLLGEDVLAVPVANMVAVCFYMCVNNESFVAEPCHIMEVL